MSFATRREVLRTLVSASVAGVLPAHVLTAQQSTSAARKDFAPVREMILDAVAKGAATGVAVAVAHRGSIVWEEGFGWANRAAGTKATAHTAFTLASLTKPFTATALVALAAEGKLSLEDAANKYLTKCRLAGPNGDAGTVTVRMLGAHCSGLPTMFEGYDRDEARFVMSQEELLRNYGRLAYPPKSWYEYSNVGYAALSVIAAGVTGEEFGGILRRRVLAPLGLRDSFFGTETARLPEGAVRYDANGRALPFYTTSTPASGELFASAHDAARFAMVNMQRGGQGWLNDRWLRELHKPVFTGPAGVDTTFGWFRGSLQSGAPVISKIGGQPGVATSMYLLPSEELACVVLTNRSNGRAVCNGVTDQVMRSYVAEWVRPEESSAPATTAFVATRALLGSWEGSLANDGASMRVRLEVEGNDRVTLKLGEQAAERVVQMQAAGAALTGESTGRIEAPDALRNGARTLQITLLPHEGRLLGRVLATEGDPDIKNVMLPYVLTLQRVSS